MNAILTDSHLDKMIKICILINVILPKIACVCRRNKVKEREVRKTARNSAATAAENTLGCSSTTSNKNAPTYL